MKKKLFISLLTMGAILFSVAMSAFAAPVYQAERTIADVVQEEGQFATLAELLQSAEMVETLQGDGSFTVFAPTDTAFDSVPESNLTSLEDDAAMLKQVLQGHVVAEQLTTDDLRDMKSIETLSGETLPITVEGDTIMIGDTPLIESAIEATNGLIYGIDTVLLPEDLAISDESAQMTEGGTQEVTNEADEATTMDETQTQQTNQEVVTQEPIAGCQENYVIQADDWLSKIADRYYSNVLAYPAIFEATNNAAQQNDTYATIQNPDIIEIGQTVCIPTQESAQQLLEGTGVQLATSTDPTQQETTIEATVEANTNSDDSTAVDEAQTETTDVQPEQMDADTLLAVARDDERFSNLVDSLEAAGLENMLENEGPYTILAPVNEAFDELDQEVTQNTEELKNVLEYHIIPQELTAANLQDMDTVETINGETLPVTVDGNTIHIGDATVLDTDVEAGNGLIQVIDEVLHPVAE